VFVVFKNCDTSEVALDELEKDGKCAKCFKTCLGIDKKKKPKTIFGH